MHIWKLKLETTNNIRRVFFGVGIIINITYFWFVYPFIVGEYKGYQMGSMGGLAALFFGIIGFGLIFINLVVMVGYIKLRQYYKIPVFLFIVSVLSLTWGSLLEQILPWEKVVSYKVHQISSGETFADLKKVYATSGCHTSFSVLTQEEYFVIGDYVFNLQQETYGHTKYDCNTFGDLYNISNQHRYNTFSEIVTTLPYHVPAETVENIRHSMIELGFSDICIDTTLQGTVYAFEMSAATGTRAILVDSSERVEVIIGNLKKSGKLLNFEVVGKNAYYFHLAPEPWI